MRVFFCVGYPNRLMLIQFDVFVSNWILKNTKIQIHSSTFTERPKMWTTANGIGIGTIEKSITEVYCEYIHCRYIVDVHGRIQKMQHWFFNSSAPSSLVFHSPYEDTPFVFLSCHSLPIFRRFLFCALCYKSFDAIITSLLIFQA